MVFLALRGLAFRSFIVCSVLALSLWSLTGVWLFSGTLVLGLASDLDRTMGSSGLAHFTSGLTQCEKNVILFSASASGGSGKVELQ